MNIKLLHKAIFLNKKIGPEKVMVSPTDRCNLHCKTCWRLTKEGRYDELSFSEIRSILKECKKLGVKVLDLTGGGEPFIREDILKIAKLTKKLGFFATLTTNGTLLDEKVMRKLIKLEFDDICFSLDGYNQEINDGIRGEGTFNAVIRNIKRFEELKEELSSKLPLIRVSTVITKTNYKTLHKLVEVVSKLGVKAINFSVLFEWKTNKSLWMRSEKESEIKKFLKFANDACEEYRLRSNLDPILKYGLFEHEKPKFCFAPWTMLFINASGDAMVCCTLATLYKNLVGNVKERSLSEIWFGEKMEMFRTSVKKGKLFNECKKCLPEFAETYDQMYKELLSSA